ncbi:MAG: hypothetical protein ABIY55_31720 [Kofleriaceae bacterium]
MIPTAAVAVWLGAATPVRSVRWLDGALATAAQFDDAIAIAAGPPSWLDLAADRAARLGLRCVGVPTELLLDYLGWAQIVAAVVRQVGATTVLVDEASRTERFAEVAAIAELIDAAQLTHVVALVVKPVLQASRAAGALLQTVRIHGPAVIGLRIAGPPIDDYPTPLPSAAMRRLDLAAIGLDPAVLGHRALPAPPRLPARRSAGSALADELALHIMPRRRAPRSKAGKGT